MKLHFDTDYMRGCHPAILQRLVETNMDQTPGYGSDEYTEKARRLIKDACDAPDADVFFLVGGTQTNKIVIDALLKKHEGVLCADSGHINVHESGAIEASGHKVITLSSYDGKISADDVDKYLRNFYADDTYEHMVAPGMVYISYPTEYGTLYSRNELESLKSVCRKHRILLFADGARLGYGLAAQPEITLKDLSEICDVFYIGGTKVGALFGEAVVVPRNHLIAPILPIVKQNGALLAKGRLLGIQFETLFTDKLYNQIGKSAVDNAIYLKEGFKTKGYKVYIDSPTNQQFFQMPNEAIDKLEEIATFEYWGPRGEKESIIRMVTDWGTTKKDIDAVLNALPLISLL